MNILWQNIGELTDAAPEKWFYTAIIAWNLPFDKAQPQKDPYYKAVPGPLAQHKYAVTTGRRTILMERGKQFMDVHLLEIVYDVKNRVAAEHLLSQTNTSGTIISIERYGDEILAILADTKELLTIREQIQQHSAISFCEAKQGSLYRISTCAPSAHVLCAFPFRAGEEWYIGSQKTVYLSLQSHALSDRQIYWLLENTGITAWEDTFPLVSVLVMQHA